MKKSSLVTAALFAGMAVMAQGQPIGSSTPQPVLRTPMEVKTRFGLKAGVNMAEYRVVKDKYADPSLAPSTQTKSSYNAGAFVNIPLTTNFRLQPEVVLSSQGSKITEQTKSATGTKTYTYEEDLHYINVPVMFQFQTNGGFFVETGPQVGLLLDARAQGTTPYSTTDNTDIKDKRDKVDFAWSGGLGYLSRIGLGIDARYNMGISNLIDGKNTSGTTGNGALKNRVIQVGLVYQFGAYK